MTYDFLVVGAGLSGCVLAREIATVLRKTALVVDKRAHVAGKMADGYNLDGVFVHWYGFHVFHTSNQNIVEYLSRFTTWTPTTVKSLVKLSNGTLVPLPLNRESVNVFFGKRFESRRQVDAFMEGLRCTIDVPANAEEKALSQVGEQLYREIFRGITLKRWGVAPTSLPAAVMRRCTVRNSLDSSHQTDRFQAVPTQGYSQMCARLLDDPRITVVLNADYRAVADSARFSRIVYTGSIDEFFANKYGPLPYRTMRFEYETKTMARYQRCHQVFFPGPEPFSRCFEFKHATGQEHPKTTICREYPGDWTPGSERDYPLPVPACDSLRKQYQALAAKERFVHFCGRLGDYRYYTMAQAVSRALQVFQRDIAPDVA